jgi:hypothetical protein
MSDFKLPGKDTEIYRSVRSNLKYIIEGSILCLDPSMGSMSSQPGYAVYRAGKLVESGKLNIDPRGEKWERLHELHRQLRNLSRRIVPDLCLYENVPVSAHGGRSQVSHASLLMAVGVTLAAVEADAFIGITPMVWKSRIRDTYVKSDEADAIEFGWITIEIAKLIAQKDPYGYYNRVHTDVSE